MDNTNWLQGHDQYAVLVNWKCKSRGTEYSGFYIVKTEWCADPDPHKDVKEKIMSEQSHYLHEATDWKFDISTDYVYLP